MSVSSADEIGVRGPARPPVGRRRVEIACDESGFSGGNLAGHERIFAHASVDLDLASAAALVTEVHARLGVRGGEVKASRLRQPDAEATLRRLLGPDGGLLGHAVVHLTDTQQFVLARLLHTLERDGPPDGTSCPGLDPNLRDRSAALQRLGVRGVGAQRWQQFLGAAVQLMWTNRRVPAGPVERFFADLSELRATTVDLELRRMLQLLLAGRERAERLRAAYADDPSLTPLLVPLVPALSCAVHRWAAAADDVEVVHDEQSTLTPSRVAAIATSLSRRRPGRRLTVRPRTDSRHDPRIQVADWLAGVARRAASDALTGRLDAKTWEQLQPYRGFPCDAWLSVTVPTSPPPRGSDEEVFISSTRS